jgi:dTDP-4-dehydrorhamnose reductase
MNILLIGRDGQVGQELIGALSALGPVTALGRADLDLAQPDQIAATVADLQPEVIVNAAAYTAVDRAESEPELADCINAKAPEHLAKAAAACNARLVHISTDYVFNGEQSRPYRETDATAPLGVYGQSKLAGEAAIRAHAPQHLILRTAWVYGAQGKANFVKTMLRLGAERESLRVVYDQVGSPTWAQDIAQAIAQLIPKMGSSTFGTYHYTNSGVASWYDFAIAIFEEAHALGYPLNVQQVEPITTDQYPTPAQRPPYSVLTGGKIASLLGQHAPHWRSSLRAMLKEMDWS